MFRLGYSEALISSHGNIPPNGGMHRLLTSPLAKADSAHMSATKGRSSAAIGKKKALLLECPCLCMWATKKICCGSCNKVSNSNNYFFFKLARVTGTVNISPWDPHHVDVATTQPFCSFISLANFFIPIL